MSAESNKALFTRVVEEVFNQGKLDTLDEIFAADFVEHEELPGGIPSNREGVKMLTAGLRAGFPDFKFTIDDMVAEGDKVVVRSTWTGTQNGEFMGMPPSGRSISFGVIDIVRFADGKFAEHWGQMDGMRMMQQLGAIPAPGEGQG